MRRSMPAASLSASRKNEGVTPQRLQQTTAPPLATPLQRMCFEAIDAAAAMLLSLIIIDAAIFHAAMMLPCCRRHFFDVAFADITAFYAMLDFIAIFR